MNVIVNGLPAVIKSGSSVEYIAENRLFSGSDGYSLAIDFPIADCPANRKIFGHINRKDVALGKIRFDCAISERSVYLRGTLTVTKVSDSFVTCQFLEGRSAQNFDDSFDKVFINELDLGGKTVAPSEMTPAEAWNLSGSTLKEAVALPWVNDSSDGVANNFATFTPDREFEWDNPSLNLSFFPYLLPLTKKICNQIGYTFDFSKWEASDFRWLLVCNTLPPTWEVSGYARALPHWTVTEFFEKLELLMNCEFDINHTDKKISMGFVLNAVDDAGIVNVSQVVDSYSSEVAPDEKSANYIGLKNISYKDPGYEAWSIRCCDWFVKQWPSSAIIRSFDTFAELWSELSPFAEYDRHRLDWSKDGAAKRLLYARDLDMYFLLKVVKSDFYYNKEHPEESYYSYKTVLIPINEFGKRVVNDDEDAEVCEIDFVPVRIEDTDKLHGNAMFLSLAAFAEDSPLEAEPTESDDPKSLPCIQSQPLQALMRGEKEMAEYFSVINVGFWNGSRAFDNEMPFPNVSPIVISPSWQYSTSPFSLRLTRSSYPLGSLPSIDPTIKYSFSFISDTIPNPRAVFFIAGKRYLCEKITATFTENGMSQLLKGEFYPLRDS